HECSVQIANACGLSTLRPTRDSARNWIWCFFCRATTWSCDWRVGQLGPVPRNRCAPPWTVVWRPENRLHCPPSFFSLVFVTRERWPTDAGNAASANHLMKTEHLIVDNIRYPSKTTAYCVR